MTRGKKVVQRGDIIIVNNSKIKYIQVVGELYKVTDISFSDLKLTAHEMDSGISDIPENEIFSLLDVLDFRVKLVNCNGNKIDFKKYGKNHS